jgi:hypothetical protein
MSGPVRDRLGSNASPDGSRRTSGHASVGVRPGRGETGADRSRLSCPCKGELRGIPGATPPQAKPRSPWSDMPSQERAFELASI